MTRPPVFLGNVRHMSVSGGRVNNSTLGYYHIGASGVYLLYLPGVGNFCSEFDVNLQAATSTVGPFNALLNHVKWEGIVSYVPGFY